MKPNEIKLVDETLLTFNYTETMLTLTILRPLAPVSYQLSSNITNDQFYHDNNKEQEDTNINIEGHTTNIEQQ